MSQTPKSVLAVDAFGLEAVQEVCPDWEGRFELSSEQLAKAAARSKVKFATDGQTVLPEGYLGVSAQKLGGIKLRALKAIEALNIFGLTTLADANERGVARVTPEASAKLEAFTAAGKTRTQTKPLAAAKEDKFSPLKGRSQVSLRDKILKLVGDHHELTLNELTKLVGVKQATVKPVIDTLVKSHRLDKASASRYVLTEGLRRPFGAAKSSKVHA